MIETLSSSHSFLSCNPSLKHNKTVEVTTFDSYRQIISYLASLLVSEIHYIRQNTRSPNSSAEAAGYVPIFESAFASIRWSSSWEVESTQIRTAHSFLFSSLIQHTFITKYYSLILFQFQVSINLFLYVEVNIPWKPGNLPKLPLRMRKYNINRERMMKKSKRFLVKLNRCY